MLKFYSIIVISLFCQNIFGEIAKSNEARADSVMHLMTLDEKIGQLNQYTSDKRATGKITPEGDKATQIRQGKVGSMMNVIGAEEARTYQELAMQSRLRIPLIFGQDVIHGFRTTFPVPLGETATWDLALMEKSSRIAATEAAAYGIHWTFAPMVDIARDPRWGRVMEGAGEDTYLGSLVAKARVKGFQGNGLGNVDVIMACAKHFAAYGAAVGGRDYNSVDMSLRQLNEIYLPPFKAAVEANVATFMNSFNDINGIPATANKYILRDILKTQWNFKGFVVSDWGSVGEMITHGFAKDGYDAAMKAIIAGTDMDMESRCYRNNLKQLIEDGKIDISIVDEAVKRILVKKFELGLFEDPFRFCNLERQKQQTNNLENRIVAREIGAKSIVLLKNEIQKNGKSILPLSKQTKKIALIGPLFKATTENHGFWAMPFADDTTRIISQYQGIKNQLDKSSTILYAKGCHVNGNDKTGFADAINAAKEADIVILSLGETAEMSGEAKSRSSLQLPGVQEDLMKEIYKTGKPIILLLNSGRPLIFNWAADNIPSILYTWWLGTEAGNSIADVVFGNYNPAGKLPISFPRTEGQIPIYYNHFNTGRPARSDNDKFYVSSYIDLKNSPQYSFGYGLSYTKFIISNLKLSSDELSTNGDKLTATVDITNTGDYDGEEVLQLYVRDMVGCVVRPVKELKGFKKIFLKKGDTKTVSLSISSGDLKFYNDQIEYINEPGDYELYIGNSSDTQLKTNFKLVL
jgi:beta-glucosidase